MKTYSIEEQDAIGARIAEIFGMRHDSEYKDRWRTTWGTKTNVGIFNTVLRLAEDISNGEEIK